MAVTPAGTIVAAGILATAFDFATDRFKLIGSWLVITRCATLYYVMTRFMFWGQTGWGHLHGGRAVFG